jgi:hypothetical protein
VRREWRGHHATRVGRAFDAKREVRRAIFRGGRVDDARRPRGLRGRNARERIDRGSAPIERARPRVEEIAVRAPNRPTLRRHQRTVGRLFVRIFVGLRFALSITRVRNVRRERRGERVVRRIERDVIRAVAMHDRPSDCARRHDERDERDTARTRAIQIALPIA